MLLVLVYIWFLEQRKHLVSLDLVDVYLIMHNFYYRPFHIPYLIGKNFVG